jgi:hypothetical protein
MIIRSKRRPLLRPETQVAGSGTTAFVRGNCRAATTLYGETAAQVPSNSLRCATLVAMVQTADLWEGDNGACRRRLNGPRLWAILIQREMGPASVVITKVRRQHTAQVTLIEDDDVIETFAADRADDALDVGILPWRSRCSDDLLDRHRLNTIAEDLPI